MKIFCLEDNALVVMHLEMVIEEAGHELVGCAASFAEALPALETTPFDLALVDIDLTDGKTGMDAARHIAGRNRLAIFVTGQVDVAEANCDLVMAIVGKPIDEAVLKKAFAEAEARLAPAGG